MHMSSVWYSLCFGSTLLFFNLSQTLLAQQMAGVNQEFPFKLSALVLTTEIVKVFIVLSSIFSDFLKHGTKCDKKFWPTRRTFFLMSVPAMLYTISNTMAYRTVALMGSTNSQVWSNTRIIITAVLCRVLVPRDMSIVQWLAVFFLLIGVLCCKEDVGDGKSYTVTMQAIFCAVTQTFSSSLAGVYQEILFKTNKDERIAVKSIALYSWTCLTSFIQWEYESAGDESDFFQGFTHLTWFCVLVNALYGQIVALTLFFCDNFVKVFASSLGPIAAMIMDVFYLKSQLSLNQSLGIFIVFMSTILFYSKIEWLSMKDHEALYFLRGKNLSL